MRRFLSNIKEYLIMFGALALCLMCSVWWFNGEKKEVYDASNDTFELSDEDTGNNMEEFVDSYEEMTAEGGQENMLIVVSEGRPKEYGAEEVLEGPNHTYYLMFDSIEERDSAYVALMDDDMVSVEKNAKMEPLDYASWGIETMGIDIGINALGEGKRDAKVAVIDTGLDVAGFREAFPDRNLDVYDIESDSDRYEDMKDNNGHGTFVAGVIAEGTVKRTGLLAIRVEKNGEIWVSDVNTAIYKAIQVGVDAINLSLGSDVYSESQRIAINAAKQENIITVASAGNENSSKKIYPASYDNTISVAALDYNRERAVWDEANSLGSNYNEMVDYAAPGTLIRSINGYASGTSVATPHVTAAVALLKQYNGELGFDDVNMLLKEHVVDLGEEGKDDYYGYGMIDFNDAEFCGGSYCDEYGVFAVDAPEEQVVALDRHGAIAIPSANILIDEPVAGGHPDFTLEADGEHYTVAIRNWVLYDSSLDYPELTAESVFEKGEDYELSFDLVADEGYAFAEDAEYTVNGHPAYLAGGVDETNVFVRYHFEIPDEQVVEQWLTSANILMDEPVAGGHPDVTLVTDEEHYRVEFDSWVRDDGADYVEIGAEDVFESGKTYELSYCLYTDEPYGFTDDAAYTVNGRLAGRAGGSGATYILVRYRFQIPEEGEPLDINDRTGGIAMITALSDGVKVTAEKACAVAITDDGGRHYTRIPAVAVDGEENTYRFRFTVYGTTNVVVALNGDGDFDGVISTGDSNLINRSLISASLLPYRPLSALEAVIFDVDGDSLISTGDSNLINRSLISASLLPYREIGW